MLPALHTSRINMGLSEDLETVLNRIPPKPEVRERKISNLSAYSFWEVEFPGKQENANIVVKVEKKFSVQSPVPTENIVPVEEHPKRFKYRKSTQILSAIAANMGAFALGTVLAWSATAVPSMRQSGDVGEITDDETAWISSIVTLGALASCPAAAYLMVTLGRRRTMLLLAPIFSGGWILIRFHNSLFPDFDSVSKIYVGRFLTGFCGGAYSVISPVYIAETAHEKIRGGLASGFDLMLSVGMLYIYAIGGYTSWQIQTLACSAVPVMLLIIMLFVPESPRFLVEKGRLEDASKALKWLYGIKEDENVHSELSKLTKSVEDSQARPVNFDRVILKMSVLKPTLLSFAIIAFYTLCGVDAIVFYTVDIFKSTGTGLDPSLSTITVGVVQLVATVPALFIVDKYGRRPLLIISEIFMAVALSGMGTFFYLTNYDDVAHTMHMRYAWLPLVSLNLFIIAYSLGIGPLALALLGELVPSHITGMMTCVALMLRWALGFGVTIFFEKMGEDIGLDNTYWGFAFLCTVGAVFIYFCLPETKGKSLDDIQAGFIHPSKKVVVIKPEQYGDEGHIHRT